MMKSIMWVALAWMVLQPTSHACLTFRLQHEDRLIYGRNFDWDVDLGAVMINRRHYRKTAFVLPPNQPLSWVSRYGSVTFNQFSKEVPVGGINEKGLVIECMVSSAKYPLTKERPAINELQWIQYHLDTCATVAEVMESALKIRIAPYAVRLHYLIVDATGACAAAEYIDEKLVFHTGDTLPTPALANRSYQLELARVAEGGPSRFGRCAAWLEKYDGRQDIEAYAFKTLDAVKQDDFTKWQMVYDIPSRRVSFRSLRNSKIRSVSLKDFDFEDAEPLMADINAGSGDLKSRLQPYSKSRNSELMRKCLAEFKKHRMMRHITNEHLALIQMVIDANGRRELPED